MTTPLHKRVNPKASTPTKAEHSIWHVKIGVISYVSDNLDDA